MDYHPWLCTLSGVIANVLSGAGLVFQRKAKTKVDALERDLPLWRNRTWISGISFTLVGAGFDFMSYLGAPLFILALVSCMRLPFIAVLSTFILDEKIDRYIIIAIAMCAVGALLVIQNMTHRTPHYETYGDFFRPLVCQYFIFSLFVAFLLPICLWKGVLPMRYANIALPFCSALLLALSKALNVVVDKVTNPPQVYTTVILAFIAFFGMGDFGLNAVAVQIVRPSIFAPTFFGFFYCLLLFQSLLLFEEFNGDPHQLPMTLFGALLCLAGALLCRQADDQTHDVGFEEMPTTRESLVWDDPLELEIDASPDGPTVIEEELTINERATVTQPPEYEDDT